MDSWCYSIKSTLKHLKEQYFVSELAESSLGIKYPTFRDHPLHTGAIWLNGKRADDGAEGLWRIHDGLYDLKSFVDHHPGGKDWIRMTEGTDITEAFESHHLSPKADSLLPKYFVRKTTSPRNYPFTFEENGFYRTLKKRVYNELKTLPAAAVNKTKFMTDLLAISYVLLSLFAVYSMSFTVGMMAGVAVGLTAIAAHNFFHQKDNFRMYYFNLTLLESRSWRISHALSHHMYPNTINDMEISGFEPFFQFLPTRKNWFTRYVSWVYTFFFYPAAFPFQCLVNHVEVLFLGEKYRLEMMLPFTILPIMHLIAGQSIYSCLFMFIWIQLCGSFYFALIGVNAAHHHPDIFHDGDKPRANKDWGMFQMDAVMDRNDITGSPFRVLTNFGDHALHHLFPTVDHGHLNDLYTVFLKTCDDFGINWRLVTQFELVKGQYRQLARNKPNNRAPNAVNKGKTL